jgi:hypothetical protein
MPILPSGRKVAVDASPFDDLIKEASAECSASLLLGMEHPQHILAHFNVLEVEQRSDVPEEELAYVDGPWSDMHCMTYETGYTASDFVSGCSDWPESDVLAFAQFLESRRIKLMIHTRYRRLQRLHQHLAQIDRLKSQLGEDLLRILYSINPRRR